MAKRRPGQAPPPGAPTTIRITSVPTDGTAIHVAFLSGYRSVITHWHRGMSYPCLGDECPRDIHRSKCVWKGFAPARMWRDHPHADWLPTVLEVTESLDEVLRGTKIRGQIWRLMRQTGQHGKPEVTGQFIGDVAEPIGASFDVIPIVTRMYRPPAPIIWDVPSPLPPRVIVEGIPGAPPPGVATVASTSAADVAAEKARLAAIMEQGRKVFGIAPRPEDGAKK